MANDNIYAQQTTVSGALFRTFSDGTNEWTPAIACYIAGGSANAWSPQYVDATHGLPINLTQVGSSSFSLGQQLAASSLPVVLTAAQMAILTPLTDITANAGSGTFATSLGSSTVNVSVVGGSVGNPAAGATGSAVPSQANYGGLNVSGTLRGQTGVNPTGTTFAAQVDLASIGGVSLGSVAVPVSGTVTANAGSGTFTVNPGNTANTTPWLTSISGTPTVSLGSSTTIPVTGVVTANAGSGTMSVSGTVTANAGSGTFTTSLGSATIPVSVVSGSTGNAAASNTGSAVPAQAGYTGVNVSGTLRGQTASNPSGSIYAGQIDIIAVGGVSAATGSGTTTTGTLRTVIASDDTISVAVVSGTTGNTAASATGSAVPSSADYGGINVSGTLRGRTGVSPSGSVFAAQTDVTSVAGSTVAAGSGVATTGTLRITQATDDTVRVTGTVTANAGSGTMTVNPGNTANTTAWLVSLGSSTVPVSGTVTANAGSGTMTVNQAGGPWTQNVTQLGGVAIALNTGVRSSGTLRVTQATDDTISVNIVQSNSTLGQTTSANSVPVVIASDQSNVGITITGSNTVSLGSSTIPVSVVSGSAGNAAASNTGSAVPAQAGYTGLNVAGTLRGLTGVNVTGSVYAGQVDVTSIGGTAVATGSGVITTATQRVVIASDDTVAVSLGGTPAVSISGTPTISLGASTVPVSGTVTANAGSGTFTVNPGNTANTTAWLVSVSGTPTVSLGSSTVPVSVTGTPAVTVNAATSGGYTPYSVVWPGNTAGVTIKTSAGTVGGMYFGNSDSIDYFAKIYDKATTPLSSDTPVLRVYIPTGGGNDPISMPACNFLTGIGLRISGGATDSDTTTVNANKVLANLLYK